MEMSIKWDNYDKSAKWTIHEMSCLAPFSSESKHFFALNIGKSHLKKNLKLNCL